MSLLQPRVQTDPWPSPHTYQEWVQAGLPPPGLCHPWPLPARSQGRRCPWRCPEPTQPRLSPPHRGRAQGTVPSTRAQRSEGSACSPPAVPPAPFCSPCHAPAPRAPGARPWPPSLGSSPKPPQGSSCRLPFAPAIRAPASTLPACANTETHLNKLRRHNKSKGNEGLCLGAGESLEFNYIGKPFAAKAW